jgi:hypothetical protein
VAAARRTVWSAAPLTSDDGASDSQLGGPPPVLLAALGAALLIAVGLIAAFASLGGDGGAPDAAGRPVGAATTTAEERVLLTVSVGGSGIGDVQITPSDVSCNASCEYKFMEGTRVTATAEALAGSRFQGWGDACSGKGRCSFVMNRTRSLSAKFVEEPTATVAPLCDGVAPEDRDPTCPPEEPGTTTEPVEPGPDCSDGRDNDDDGLTDTEQDPDCETSGDEAGTAATPEVTPPPAGSPPPSIAPNECTDGRDNDGDGLTDRAQDPDCEKGRSESG